MKKELDEALVKKYPHIFKDRFRSPQETLMCFGFECGDGWYNIIDVLCELLTSEYRQAKERYDCRIEIGVGGILYGTKTVTQEDIDEAKKLMEEAEEKIPVAVQVKEKFGGLRFYLDRATEQQYNYVTFAESMSYRTCEVCGDSGDYYTDGWHQVLCEKHAKEMGREKKYTKELDS